MLCALNSEYPSVGTAHYVPCTYSRDRKALSPCLQNLLHDRLQLLQLPLDQELCHSFLHSCSESSSSGLPLVHDLNKRRGQVICNRKVPGFKVSLRICC